MLQKLKRDAEAYLGEEVTDAVVTVPAYFNDAQRQATKEAGDDRGPQRAADHQRAHRRGAGVRAGQGRAGSRPSWSSTSAAAPSTSPCWRSGEGVIEVKATAGDNHLGGDDWDQRIIDAPGQAPSTAQNGIDLSKDKMAMQRLQEAAEKAKIELSARAVDDDQPAVHHGRRRRPAAPGRHAVPGRVPADDAGPAGPRQGPVPAGHQGRQDRRRRRSTTSSWSAARPGCRPCPTSSRADRRQGAQQGRQPGRGRRRRRRAAGRRAQGRGQGRPAARRHPAVPGHRDQGRHHHQADRAQHHDPDQALGDLHHGRRQPAVRADPGLPGRARDGGVQQEARHVRADRPAAGAARRPADRGHLRHRRQRHRARLAPRTSAPARSRR